MPESGGEALNGRDGWEELARELERSRRYGREFALVAIASGTRSQRFAVAAFREAVDRLVRRIDSVWSDREMVFALLPESPRGAALRLVERVAKTTPAASCEWTTAVAVFPVDAVTAAGLLETLQRELDAAQAAADAANVTRVFVGADREARTQREILREVAEDRT